MPSYLYLCLDHLHMLSSHALQDVIDTQSSLPDHLACHCSSIGLIPKPHQPGKWRLIVDLSSPAGHSVNDSISTLMAHTRYSSVLNAAALIRRPGPGAKVDLKNAYRVLPIHADDHPLLAIRWGSKVYLDAALLFRL